MVDRRTCIAPHLTRLSAYRKAGCRCYDCGAFQSAYEQNRKAAVKAGTWQPFVDAAPVIAHLDALAAEGIGFQRIAAAAGLKVGLVTRYTNRFRPRPRRIRPAAAEALLAVTAFGAMSAGRLVPSVGSQRRAQALAAIGWPLAAQAARVGVARTEYRNAINRPRIHVRVARKIADLFEELSATPGPSLRSRRYAMQHGWPAPLAWDDDIDDPAASPVGHLSITRLVEAPAVNQRQKEKAA